MANGWDAYIDTQLIGTNTVKEAAICSIDDASIWASTSNFKPDTSEIKAAVNAFNSPEALAANGLKLCGVKYFFISLNEPGVIRLKQGSGGAIVVKTCKTIIIATYDSSIQPGQCSTTVENLGDYLRGLNF
ncbi:unnamed protein product [Gordionus sp. m RMFG-2023]|uniref:profilin-2-like n=1 Tax=Gordionus sp. m RMFG-2023 TaxID=3053472 RepID=UPI0030E1B892